MKSRKLGLSVNLLIVIGLSGSLVAADRYDEPISQDDNADQPIARSEPRTPTDNRQLETELQFGNDLSGPETGTAYRASAHLAAEHRLTQVLSSGATNGGNGVFNLVSTLGQPLSGREVTTSSILVQGFWSGALVGPRSCCFGRVGDVDGNGFDEPDISDIAMLIDNLYITGRELLCLPEADVNQSGGFEPIQGDLSIHDVTTLVDYLFITGPENFVLNDCL